MPNEMSEWSGVLDWDDNVFKLDASKRWTLVRNENDTA